MVNKPNIADTRLALEEQLEKAYWRGYQRGKVEGHEQGYAEGIRVQLAAEVTKK